MYPDHTLRIQTLKRMDAIDVITGLLDGVWRWKEQSDSMKTQQSALGYLPQHWKQEENTLKL